MANSAVAHTERARQLRKKETWAEKLMWRWLRDRRFCNYKFRRQHPLGIYCVDFFGKEARLVIELDGRRHGFPDAQRHDSERDKFLQSLGIKTLRFWNSHLQRNGQSIRDTIFYELQKRAPHPLPDYTRPMVVEKSRVSGRNHKPSPHPDPLPSHPMGAEKEQQADALGDPGGGQQSPSGF